MDNIVQRIRQLCAGRNISVSKMEKDLGFGNGYLNPKKVSTIKLDRLLKILDYMGISYLEFANIGLPETQAINSALVQLKKVSPEVYEDMMARYIAEEKEKPATKSDGISDERHSYLNSLFDQLTPENQEFAVDFLKKLSQSQ